jgi:hypothetical protein
MQSAPQWIIPKDAHALPAVRLLFSRHPHYQDSSAQEIACVLQAYSFLNHRPLEEEVEAALEALAVEDEVLA